MEKLTQQEYEHVRQMAVSVLNIMKQIGQRRGLSAQDKNVAVKDRTDPLHHLAEAYNELKSVEKPVVPGRVRKGKWDTPTRSSPVS